MTYPKDWPRCPHCGEPALDGHITCGDVRCNEGATRRNRNTDYRCTICGLNWVDAENGFDTCSACLRRA